MKRRMFLAVSVAAAFFTAGCPKASTIHKLTVAEHDFKGVVQSFQDAELAEFQAGQVDAPLHQKMEAGIQDVALAGKNLTLLLQQNASPQTIKQQLDNIYTLLDNLLADGVLQVKNAKSKATLELALDSIKAIIANAETLLTT